jgi:ATP-dependent exoDNAse (exonuclease V) beta subunit
MSLPILDLRDRALLDRDLVVSAGAGSGKTFTLSVLVCGTLGRGEHRPQDLLATTFSEAAATDLRARLLRPLDLLASIPESRWAPGLEALRADDEPAFAAWLAALPFGESAAKSREEVRHAAWLWTTEAGARPAWMASAAAARLHWRRTRREAELLRVGTLHSLALGLLAQAGQAPRAVVDALDPALLRLLRREVRAHFDAVPSSLAFALSRLLPWVERNWGALSKAHDAHRDALGRFEAPDPAPLAEGWHAAMERLAAGTAPFLRGEAAVAKNARVKEQPFRALGPAPEGASRRLRWALQLSELAFADGVPKASLTDAFKEALAPFADLAGAWEDLQTAVLEEALARFETAKAARRLSTFGDLVRGAVEGLRAGRIPPPAPALLLVDEVQDVSPAQDALLEALGARRTVRVGDLKQAIYGFRGGDPELLRARLAAAKEAGAARRLQWNHRSRAPIIRVANALVEELWPMADPKHAPEDGAQEAARPEGPAVALVRREGRGTGQDLVDAADWIAALARPEGFDAAAGPAPEGPRRRALLLRQRTRLPRLRMLLHRAGVEPFVLSQEGFWDSPGVRLLRAALEWAAHPERPLPRAVLLRQWVGLTDGAITALHQREGRLPDPADLAEEGLDAAQAEAVAQLRALRGQGTAALAGGLLSQGPLWRLLAATERHGAQEPFRARRNLGAFVALLLGLPDSPAAALAALDELAGGAPKGDVPAEPEGADLLIQTAHASKGLEYEDVILPCLSPRKPAVASGQVGTLADGRFTQGWRLGKVEGPRLRALKADEEARHLRDELNLFYVALTRAKERLVLLAAKKGEGPSWAHWAEALGTRLSLPEPSLPPLAPRRRAESELSGLEAPMFRPPLLPAGAQEEDEAARQQRMQEGELMHAYLRDLLLRWEDETAFQACLDASPPVAKAKEMALRALAALEHQGWRHLPRRTELPLAGTAASGALGRADLVLWAPDRHRPDAIHLVDFKHSSTFDAEALETYRAQLARYAAALSAQAPVTAWLLALRSGELVEVPLG